MYLQQRLQLSPFTWEQAQEYLSWVNREDIAPRLTRALPVTTLEHQAWYENLVRRSDAVVFSLVGLEDQAYLGNCWLWNIHPIHRSAELRILLAPQAQGRGYGVEAVRGLLKVAFGHLNLHKIYLYVLAENLAAVRTFEKAGFRCEGELEAEFFLEGRYRKALRMGLISSFFEPNI